MVKSLQHDGCAARGKGPGGGKPQGGSVDERRKEIWAELETEEARAAKKADKAEAKLRAREKAWKAEARRLREAGDWDGLRALRRRMSRRRR